jgi:hypothetical protein
MCQQEKSFFFRFQFSFPFSFFLSFLIVVKYDDSKGVNEERQGLVNPKLIENKNVER